MMCIKPFIKIAVFVFVMTLVLINCDPTDDTIVVSPEDSLAAIDLVIEANTELETLMTTMMNAEPDSIQDMLDLMDFSAAYDLYVSANELNPYNADANFGLAFTGLLMISQNAELQAMIESWDAYFSNTDPFYVNDGMGKVNPTLPFELGGSPITLKPMLTFPMVIARMSVTDVPQFSEFQAIALNVFLPVIERSLEALDAIQENSDYVFLVSAGMQGEPEADPIELDMTEMFAIEAGLQALSGLLNTVIAYNFDFATHDSAGIMAELSQGSDFATLKADGSGRLNTAHQAGLLALDAADAALAFLQNETDNQDNDLIQADPDMIAEVETLLADARSALLGPTTVHYSYWDDNQDEEFMDSLQVDASQFFLNPIQDFKAMLPPYTMGTALEYDYMWVTIQEAVNVEYSEVLMEGLDNDYISVNLSYYSEGDQVHLSATVNLGFFYYDLATANQSDLPAAVWDVYNQFLALVDQYSAELYNFPQLYFSWSGYITSGASLILQGNVFIDYEERIAAYVVPSPSWDAPSFDAWLDAWPDPTMHGIFPGMDAQGIADFLGINAENWQDF